MNIGDKVLIENEIFEIIDIIEDKNAGGGTRLRAKNKFNETRWLPLEGTEIVEED